jgi:glucuronoarabinoxylan endo-1,4-beta-xylanase
MHFKITVITLWLLCTSACGGGGTSGPGTGSGPGDGSSGATATVLVHYDQPQQTLAGFGASITWVAADLRWFSPANQSAILDVLYSTTSPGAGLSIIRAGSMLCELSPFPGTFDWSNPFIQEQMAWMNRVKATYGVDQFMVTTWTPPAYMKDNNSCSNGGSLRLEDYQSLADMSVLWLQNAQASLGQEIGVWSVQNEPDFVASYDSAIYTPEQFGTYITGYLKPALQHAGLTTRIMAPEPACWSGASTFDSNWGFPLLQDNPAMQADLDILATHDYCANNALDNPSQAALQFDKPIWQTEVFFGIGYDGSMGDALGVAQSIYQALNQGIFNAWFYWWTMDFTTGNGGVLAYNTQSWTFQVPKRAYAIGNFSRFMRPGSVVLRSASSTASLQATAVRPPTGGLVLVLANPSRESVTVTVTLSNMPSPPPSVTPFRTSTSENQAQLRPVAVINGTITTTLPPGSIVTLVG